MHVIFPRKVENTSSCVNKEKLARAVIWKQALNARAATSLPVGDKPVGACQREKTLIWSGKATELQFDIHKRKCVLQSQYFILTFLAGFLKTLTSNGPFRPPVFFGQISKVAIIKTKSATIAVFLFSSFLPPRSLFFSFPFTSLAWFWSLSRPQNLSFDPFLLKSPQISLGWFSKNRLDV